MRPLPPEILAEIFTTLVGSASRHQRIRLPWTLARICRGWRQIALGLTRIWCEVNAGPPHGRGAAARIETELLRGGSRLVSVCFRSSNDEECEDVLRALARECERWQSAKLQLTSAHLGILTMIQGRLPALRALDVRVGDPRGVAPDPRAVNSQPFQTAPKLREVVLNSFMSTHIVLSMPFSQLRRVQGTWDHQMHAVLLCARNVEHVEARMGWVGVPANGAHVVLPKLRQLNVQSMDHLHWFTTPCLRELTIYDASPRLLGHFSGFVERGADKELTSLHLGASVAGMHKALEGMLRAVPRIEELHVAVEGHTDVLSVLGVSAEGECLGPELRWMKIVLQIESMEEQDIVEGEGAFAGAQCRDVWSAAGFRR